jgi:hypothetical protein
VDPNPSFDFGADLDPAFDFEADPDKTSHFEADPDPILIMIKVMRICNDWQGPPKAL